MKKHFDNFTLNITKSIANQGFHAGDCNEDIKRIMQLPQIKRQLNKINKFDLISELKEYGAWDESELSNHEDNLNRIVWIGCGDILDGNL